MSEAERLSGWLPVEAMDAEEARREAASRSEVDRLISLEPRLRAFELLRLLADSKPGEAPLRAADLLRLLDSFEGSARLSEADLNALFPGLDGDQR